jgi:hypothetical protein
VQPKLFRTHTLLIVSVISRAGNFSSYGRVSPVFVRPDMWQSYLKVIREKCSDALHILDRFHVREHLGGRPRQGTAAICRKVAETFDGGSIDSATFFSCGGVVAAFHVNGTVQLTMPT